MDDLLERWESGPVGLPPVGARSCARGRPCSARGPGTTSATATPRYPRGGRRRAGREHLRTRRDRRGALVSLADGRFACTGPQLALGGPRQVQRYARRRLARETDDAARAWWQEVIGALAR